MFAAYRLYDGRARFLGGVCMVEVATRDNVFCSVVFSAVVADGSATNDGLTCSADFDSIDAEGATYDLYRLRGLAGNVKGESVESSTGGTLVFALDCFENVSAFAFVDGSIDGYANSVSDFLE